MNSAEFLSLPDREAHRAGRIQDMQQQLDCLPASGLSEVERADLLLMREEEKIARDVYAQLYKGWRSAASAPRRCKPCMIN